jgi:hypothetical protein
MCGLSRESRRRHYVPSGTFSENFSLIQPLRSCYLLTGCRIKQHQMLGSCFRQRPTCYWACCNPVELRKTRLGLGTSISLRSHEIRWHRLAPKKWFAKAPSQPEAPEGTYHTHRSVRYQPKRWIRGCVFSTELSILAVRCRTEGLQGN